MKTKKIDAYKASARENAQKTRNAAAREESPEDAEYEFSYLFGAILNDETFNGYSPEEIQAAIAEAINEY